MSNEKQQAGVVIDVTPEREPEPQAASPGASATGAERATATRRHSRGPAATLAVLALLAAGVGLLLAYLGWTALQRDLAALDTRLTNNAAQQEGLRTAVRTTEAALQGQQQVLAAQEASLANALTSQQRVAAELQQAFATRERQLADEQLRLQEREAELRAAVADVHHRIGSSGSQWMVAEAEYLIRLAGHRLSLARDAATARAALELADQRLRDTLDPGWNGVREQLARDLARLSALRLPDVEGIAARLTALAEQVPRLPLAGIEHAAQPKAAGEGEIQTAAGARSWRTLWADFWGGLKDAVRIRRTDQPVQPMPAPGQASLLYQNLELQLETARLAVLRGAPGLYRDSLARATRLLAEFFAAADPDAVALAQALGELAVLDVQPELPDISGSLRALKARERLLDNLAPAPPAAGNGE